MTTDLPTRPTIRAIVRAMSAPDLVGCVQDVIAWHDTGLLGECALRALADRLVAETGIDAMSPLQMAEDAVLREASLRFVAIQTGTRPDRQ